MKLDLSAVLFLMQASNKRADHPFEQTHAAAPMSLRYTEISQGNLTRNRGRIKKIKARKANSHIQSTTISWAPAMSAHASIPERGGQRTFRHTSGLANSQEQTTHNTEMRVSMVNQGARWLKPWPKILLLLCQYSGFFSHFNSLFSSRSPGVLITPRSCPGAWRADPL